MSKTIKRWKLKIDYTCADGAQFHAGRSYRVESIGDRSVELMHPSGNRCCFTSKEVFGRFPKIEVLP